MNLDRSKLTTDLKQSPAGHSAVHDASASALLADLYASGFDASKVADFHNWIVLTSNASCGGLAPGMFNAWARQQIDKLAKLIAFKDELDSKECKALEKAAPKRIEDADEAIAALEQNIAQLREALADQQNAKATAEADLLAIKVKRAELESTLDSGSKGGVVGAALQYVIDGNLGEFEKGGE